MHTPLHNPLLERQAQRRAKAQFGWLIHALGVSKLNPTAAAKLTAPMTMKNKIDSVTVVYSLRAACVDFGPHG